MAHYDLTFETLSMQEPHSGRILRELMTHACSQTGISLKNKQVMIEAMQYEHGCLLLLTVSEKIRKQKTYRIKSRNQCMVFRFDDVENLLQCLQTLCQLHERHPHSAVYRLNKSYYLVLPSAFPPTKRLRYTLAEFADEHCSGKLMSAFLQEHACPLQTANAIDTIGKFLINSQQTAQNTAYQGETRP